MRAVNLLPAKHRPRQAGGGKQGSSFVLLGVLGALVVAVLLYVVTVNGINNSKTEIAQAQAEAQRANAQADSLGAYGNFAKVKQDRVSSVKKLASGRIDWERVLREVAHVLPSGVWVNKADAQDATGGATTTTTSTSSSTSGSSAAQPQITLAGCAWSQPAVAEALVRLRQLDGATDVTLDHSTRPEDTGSSGSGDTTGSCGMHNGQPNFDFQMTVVLSSSVGETDAVGKVVDSLGGGQ
jgi:Tfp pilus assembly protein PilN